MELADRSQNCLQTVEELSPTTSEGAASLSPVQQGRLSVNRDRRAASLAHGQMLSGGHAPNTRERRAPRAFLSENYLSLRRYLRNRVAFVNTRGWQFLIVFFTAASCVVYVIETYIPHGCVVYLAGFASRKRNGCSMSAGAIFILVFVDLLSYAAFIMDYILSLLHSPSYFTYMFSFIGLVDLISILPLIKYFSVPVEALGFLSLLRVLKTLRIFRVQQLSVKDMDIDNHQSAVRLEEARLGLTIGGVIFVATGVAHSLHVSLTETGQDAFNYDSDSFDFEFHDALYFVVVTISTVGYGDISPVHPLVKFITAAFICMNFVWIPVSPAQHPLRFSLLIPLLSFQMQISRLSEVLAEQEENQTRYRKENHVILCGNLQLSTVRRLITEFTMADMTTEMVLLSPDAPSVQVKQFLHDPRYKQRVFYIMGAATSQAHLDLANAQHASSIFILSKRCASYAWEDTSISLTKIAIRKFLLRKRVDHRIPQIVCSIDEDFKSNLLALVRPYLAVPCPDPVGGC